MHLKNFKKSKSNPKLVDETKQYRSEKYIKSKFKQKFSFFFLKEKQN
jgi:hypothetical protein